MRRARRRRTGAGGRRTRAAWRDERRARCRSPPDSPPDGPASATLCHIRIVQGATVAAGAERGQTAEALHLRTRRALAAMDADVDHRGQPNGGAGRALEVEGPAVETVAEDARAEVECGVSGADGTLGHMAQTEQARLEIGRRGGEQREHGREIRERAVQLAPADQAQAGGAQDEGDDLVAMETVDVSAAFEEVAVDGVAEAVSIGHGDREAAGGLHDARDFAEGGLGVGDVLEDVVADDIVEAGRGEGHVAGAAEDGGTGGGIFVEADDGAGEVARVLVAGGAAYVEQTLAGARRIG